MSCPIRLLTAAALITIGWLPLPGDAQVASADHGSAEPPTPTRQSSTVEVRQKPAGEFIPGCDDEAKKVIERALAAYRSLQTYQDTLIATKGRQDKEGFQKTGPSMKIACSFAKPNRIALTGPLGSLFCDGRKYWERLGPAKQYTEQDAPERIDFDVLDLGMLTFRASHPIVWLLTQKEDRPVRELFGCVKEITGITAAEFDGRPGKRISGLLRMKYLPVEDPTVSFDAWFSDETGLVEEFRLDITEAVQEMEGRGSGNARFLFWLRFQNIKFRQIVNVDSKASQAYGASALPHTVLIDRSGMIRAVHVGPLPEKKLSLQIDRMLQDDAYRRP